MSEQRQPPQAGQVTAIRAADHKIVYSDFFSVRASPVDMQITFGSQTIVPILSPQTRTSVPIEALLEQVTVAMPLPIMKALSLHLTRIVETIEGEIGNIRITKSSEPTDQHMEMVRQNLRNNPLT